LDNRIPVEAAQHARDVLLFTKDGFLACLEIVDYLAPPPRPIPRPQELQLWIKPSGKVV